MISWMWFEKNFKWLHAATFRTWACYILHWGLSYQITRIFLFASIRNRLGLICFIKQSKPKLSVLITWGSFECGSLQALSAGREAMLLETRMVVHYFTPLNILEPVQTRKIHHALFFYDYDWKHKSYVCIYEEIIQNYVQGVESKWQMCLFGLWTTHKLLRSTNINHSANNLFKNWPEQVGCIIFW